MPWGLSADDCADPPTAVGEFIASCDPATVIGLLDSIATLTEKLNTAQKVRDECLAHPTKLALQLKLYKAEARIASYEQVLHAVRREHLITEDCWYTCPAAKYEYGAWASCNEDSDRHECNCGADAINAMIDAVLAPTEPQGEKR